MIYRWWQNGQGPFEVKGEAFSLREVAKIFELRAGANNIPFRAELLNDDGSPSDINLVFCDIRWSLAQLSVLTQLHAALQGKKSGERRRLLVKWGVNDELWPLIQSWFDQEGNTK